MGPCAVDATIAGNMARGDRHGHCARQLVGTFGPVTLSVPRARLAGADGRTLEWHNQTIPAYRRLTKRAEALIARAYLSGTKYVFLASNPGTEFQPDDYNAFCIRVRNLAKRHYPYDMAVRMMLKPLELSPPVVRGIVPPIISAVQFFFLR